MRPRNLPRPLRGLRQVPPASPCIPPPTQVATAAPAVRPSAPGFAVRETWDFPKSKAPYDRLRSGGRHEPAARRQERENREGNPLQRTAPARNKRGRQKPSPEPTTNDQRLLRLGHLQDQSSALTRLHRR